MVWYVFCVDKKGTPKRRRDSLAVELSPTGMPKPKTPVSAARLTVPLSERQQMALLMQMTADKSNQPSNGKCHGRQHFAQATDHRLSDDCTSAVILGMKGTLNSLACLSFRELIAGVLFALG